MSKSLHAHRFVPRRPFASFAIIFTLLAVDGFAGSVSIASADPSGSDIVASVDVPATEFSNTPDEGPIGGQAARVEFDDPTLNAALSNWYRLAYVQGGNRLQVFEHYRATTDQPDPVLVRSEDIAWRLASLIAGLHYRAAGADQPPRWARFRTGIDTGPSAGLLFTLTYLDALTSGALVGDLRVAGTGGIGLDGVVAPVGNVEVKVAAAALTGPDVIFAPRPPDNIDYVTTVESEHTRDPADGYTAGQWLNVIGYQQAGRVAASHPGVVAVVVVHDIRQALAWLCGRTSNPNTCELARTAANIPIGA